MDIKRLLELSVLPIIIFLCVAFGGFITIPILVWINGYIDLKIWVLTVLIVSLIIYGLIIIKARPGIFKELIEKLP